MSMMIPPSALTDDQLIGEVRRLAARERMATAELVAYLAELESRGLHLALGYSLFTYCREVLHLPEDATCNRTTAARMVRKFPVILPMLGDGRLNLSTLRILAPHLTSENHRALLDEAAGKSKREVEELIARWSPTADVAASIRKQRAGTIAPLSEDRYLFKFTGSGRTVARFRRAQDLLRHAVPGGEAEEIFDRALISLIGGLEKQKFAATGQPRASKGTKDGSRDLPAHVQRAVSARDNGRCAFIGAGGRRCEATAFLEFHHLTPYAAGGAATVDKIALRCRAHNQYESDLFFAPIRASMAASGAIRPGAG
jgi:hypothetical protein